MREIIQNAYQKPFFTLKDAVLYQRTRRDGHGVILSASSQAARIIPTAGRSG